MAVASLGFVERVIMAINPRAGKERLLHRAQAEMIERSYAGASKGRRMEGWRTGATSADAEIGVAGAVLRHRMRDLVRNNPLAANAVNVLVTNIVGAGIQPRAKTGSKSRDKIANRVWAEFAARCDADGRTNFDGLTALAVREMIEGGDCFALRRRRPMGWGRLQVPLQIQLNEADHLDDRKFEDRPLTRIEGGIEYGAQGERTAYWMFRDHPGGQSPIRRTALDSVRMPADGVIHLFERQRVQNRGVPWGAPVMAALRDIDDWQVAELTRKKAEACVVGVVLGDDDEGGPGITAQDGQPATSAGPAVVDADGHALERMEPGLFAYARNGRDIKFNSPAAVGGVYEWNRVQWHYIAAGFRVPYSLITTDLSQNNFASSRVGLNDFRRMVEAIQWHLVIPVWCQPVWDWCMEAAHLAGLIDRPDVPVEWAPPAFQSVNPLQDANADLVEVRAGFASLPQKIAARGWSPHDVVAEQAEFLTETDKLKLVFDSDPRKLAKAGTAQGQVPGAPEDPAGSPAGAETPKP